MDVLGVLKQGWGWLKRALARLAAYPLVFDTLTLRFMMLFAIVLSIPLIGMMVFATQQIEALLALPQLAQVSLPVSLVGVKVAFYAMFVTGLVFSMLVGLWAARSVTNPVWSLIKHLNRLSSHLHTLDKKALLRFQLPPQNSVYEIKQLSQSFDKLLNRLSEEQRLRDEFVATLTHDLKVPLLAERQTLHYLLQGSYGPLSAAQTEVVSALSETAGQTLLLVNGLLEVSRYEAGEVKLEARPLEASTLLNQVLAELTPLAQSKEQTLLAQWETDQAYPVFGDALELRRVLHNLVHNALLNTPRFGSITCRLHNQATLEKPLESQLEPPLVSGGLTRLTNLEVSTLSRPLALDEHTIISIEDTGVGIARYDLPRLFTRFAANRGRNPMSMGLGLYNCYQVVQAHTGVLWVETTEGTGTAVNMLLPATAAAAGERRKSPERRRQPQ